MEQRLGFIRDMLDVKTLILFVMALVEAPISAQQIYELCLQDDCLSYMDVQTAIPEMVKSGHLLRVADDRYYITEKGKETEKMTTDSVAFPIRSRARAAVEQLNRDIRREEYISTQIKQKENGDAALTMVMRDIRGSLMELTLTLPSMQQARKVERAYRANPESIYQSVIISLMGEEGE